MVGNKAQKAVAAALTGMMVLGSAAPAFAAQRINGDPTWVRLDGTYTNTATNDGINPVITETNTVDGKDRYDTMLDSIIYNRETNGAWAGATEVVLAAGDSFADSLAASALAGVLNGGAGAPVITTNGAKLSPQAAKAIKYLASYNGGDIDVFVVGGAAAISDGVLKEVRDLADDEITVNGATTTIGTVNTFRKFAGANRTDTSLKIAEYMADKAQTFGDDANPYGGGAAANRRVYVACGDDWKDALAVSSFAYGSWSPLLLTGSDGLLTADQVDFVKDEVEDGVSVVVVGGPAEDAADQLTRQYKLSNVNKLVGGDRYETSALVIDNAGYGAGPIAVATGNDFADALVAGPFIGANNGALVLVGDKKEASLNAAIKAGYAAGAEDYIFGGEKAISAEEAAWVMKFV